MYDDNDNEDGNHGTSQGKPPQELPPSWRRFSLEEQLVLEEVGGLRQPLWQQLESNLACSSFGSTVRSCLRVFNGNAPPFAGIGLPSVVMC